MAQALKVLHSEAVQRFRSHLADQLQNLRDESLQPIDPEDPRWSELVEVATKLIKVGFRIDDCYTAGGLGGACLLPMPEGVIVRWSQYELSGLRYDDPRQIQRVMGDAMADVIRALGFQVTTTDFPGSYRVRRPRPQ